MNYIRINCMNEKDMLVIAKSSSNKIPENQISNNLWIKCEKEEWGIFKIKKMNKAKLNIIFFFFLRNKLHALYGHGIVSCFLSLHVREIMKYKHIPMHTK